MRSNLVLPLLLLTTSLFSGVLVERILAVVNGRPVLLSDVTLLGRVKNLGEKAALEAFIDQRLMGEEALKLPEAAVTETEENSLYRDLVSRLGGVPQDFGEADLRALVRREAVVLKYVNYRFRSEVRISDDEIKKAYQEQYGTTESPPSFLKVSDALRARLEDQRVGEQVEAWVKELRAGADIRYNGA